MLLCTYHIYIIFTLSQIDQIHVRTLHLRRFLFDPAARGWMATIPLSARTPDLQKDLNDSLVIHKPDVFGKPCCQNLQNRQIFFFEKIPQSVRNAKILWNLGHRGGRTIFTLMSNALCWYAWWKYSHPSSPSKRRTWGNEKSCHPDYQHDIL